MDLNKTASLLTLSSIFPLRLIEHVTLWTVALFILYLKRPLFDITICLLCALRL